MTERGGQVDRSSRDQPPSHPARSAGSSTRRNSWLCIAGTIVAVVLVHGRNVTQKLAFDDYAWLESKPSSVVDVLRALRPPSGNGIYRPLLNLWFDSTAAVFGPRAAPLHLFAVAAAIALALSVRWMCRELGMEMGAATVAGIFAGTNGCLVIATLWASATPSLPMGACAAIAIGLVQRPGRGRHVAAAAFLLVAILWRDSAITIPAIATVLVLARPDRRPDLAAAVRTTASLWIVALSYGMVRLAGGVLSSASDDPYHSALGPHMARNLGTILRYTGQLGMYRRGGAVEALAAAALVAVLWGVLIVGSILALRRRQLLPAAGLVAYCIGVVPFLGLTNHAMETYYVEAAIIGLSVTVGGLVEWASPKPAVLITGTVVFVCFAMVAAKVVDDRHWINTAQARAAVLAAYAPDLPITDGTLVLDEACPSDAESTKRGALFRVVLDRPDLDVEFRVLSPDDRPTTPWGCRAG